MLNQQRVFILSIMLSGLVATTILLFVMMKPWSDQERISALVFEQLLDLGKQAEAEGDFQLAEEYYQQHSEQYPESPLAFDHLAKLAQAQFLFEEARLYALKSLEYKPLNYESLLIASGAQDAALLGSSTMHTTEQEMLSRVQGFMNNEQFEFAADLLKKVLVEHADHLQAQGWLGQILARQRLNEFSSWNETLPEQADKHPEIWSARGLAAQGNYDSVLAISCFVNSLALNPTSLIAAEHLAKEGKHNHSKSESSTLAKRYAQKLRENSYLLVSLTQAKDFDLMKKVAVNFREIGQFDLADHWTEMAVQLGCKESWIKVGKNPKQAESILNQITGTMNFRESKANLSSRDWSRFIFRSEQQEDDNEPSSIQFENVAQSLGIEFQYKNGSPSGTSISHLFETTGGGIGVIDFDCDGWSDLYFAQGGQWREQGVAHGMTNRLYRNLVGVSAVDITKSAGLESFGFSQGVCVGDYNSDGFQDIYVCQLHGNLLFENQGDGTFLDVTENSGTSGDEWSLSAAFADINQDGLTDLFVVNYLDQAATRNTPCFSNGIQRACPPSQFSGAIDRLYLNNGVGQFQEISSLTGIANSPGKGMGIVVADFDKSGSLEIFVGNDGEKNFLFEQLKKTKVGFPKFEERAVLKGLATDAHGNEQATMGIAAGDINGNGLLDLLISNFYMETNTYYAQVNLDNFFDLSSQAGNLPEKSRQMLGFGLQLIDPDLDGDQDVIIANGHVDQTSVTGEPDEMLPQFFLNLGEANFQLNVPVETGGYFEKSTFGRAVAKLDWNRDRLHDICITHLDHPVAILQNTSTLHGNSLVIKLVGTDGERDAIGASVQVRSGTKTWEQQLTSGDGYLVSNERLLHFGLGDIEFVDQVSVRWQSGQRQHYKNIAVNQKFLCIENREKLIQIP